MSTIETARHLAALLDTNTIDPKNLSAVRAACEEAELAYAVQALDGDAGMANELLLVIMEDPVLMTPNMQALLNALRRDVGDSDAVHTNTLVHAANPKWLYVSAWLGQPTDSIRYDNCNFVPMPPLVIDASLPPIPVRGDLATATYVRSRNVSYAWESYAHQESGQQRVRITKLNVDTTSGDESRVEFGWLDFLTRYTAGSREHMIDGDDDEEEPKRSTKRH